MDAANYIFSEGKRLESLCLKLLDLLVAEQVRAPDFVPAAARQAHRGPVPPSAADL